jgi:nicotinamidase/pyrazinamidase
MKERGQHPGPVRAATRASHAGRTGAGPLPSPPSVRTARAVTLRPGDACIIVDVQNDFLPGGALAVPRGDEVIPVLNTCLRAFAARRLPVFATRDWHPPDHCSFKAQGGRWPAHCVAGSRGAAFAPTLELPRDTTVISKACTARREAYSGFEGTDLQSRLRAAGANRLFIGGLATDYCVLHTVIDALRLGFHVHLMRDAIRPVNLKPEDGQNAEAKMIHHGAVPMEFVHHVKAQMTNDE